MQTVKKLLNRVSRLLFHMPQFRFFRLSVSIRCIFYKQAPNKIHLESGSREVREIFSQRLMAHIKKS